MATMVIFEGTAEDDALKHRICSPANQESTPEHVFVGCPKWQSVHGGWDTGDQVFGVWVRGHIAGGLCVFSTVVEGPLVWEPQTRNQIGRLGAMRALPPTSEQVDEAICLARAAIAAHRQEDGT